MGHNQTYKFCPAKKIINKKKREPIDWEKIFANNATNKELISKWYKQLTQHNHNNNKNTIQSKNGRRPKQTFSREDIQLANKHMKRHSISLIIRQMQIKTRISYHITQVRMATIRKSTDAGEGVEKKEPSYTAAGDANWYSHCGKQYRDFFKN